ncbi:MAG: thiamine diphosphokinase [Euryarchaeota archaeon]|nr:thiamine diphosphokinase [Euryarchaeota archaeon]
MEVDESSRTSFARILVVLGGESPRRADLRRAAASAFVIAADSGAEHLERVGLTPDLVVGDLDSIRRETIARLRSKGVPCVRFPRRKGATDGDLAIAEALRRGPRELVVAAAWGDRPDHSLANVALLERASRRGLAVRGIEARARFHLLSPRRTVRIGEPRGTLVSVVPLSSRLMGLTLSGFEWDLRRASVRRGETLTMSNIVRSRRATASLERGSALLVVPLRAKAR